jgi:hypothetical protein
VVGTTEANDTWYYQAVEANAFQLFYDAEFTVPVDGTGWTAYVPGSGTAVAQDYYNNLSITGQNVSIVNNAGNAWTFGADGNLILAGGNSLVRSVANSSLDILNPDISTMIFTPDAGYSSQALVLDPTTPGHIH